MLELRNVHKSFDHHGSPIHILGGVDLVVRAGDGLAIMGASGVGKSTLLHIMGSLETPSEGSVAFEGRNVYALDENTLCHLRNRHIGFVFQFHHLLPEFNALENAMMPALIARASAGEARRMAREVLVKVGLERRLYHRTGELSGGEQQRVAIARAVVMHPKVLLADEPTGSLDWETGGDIADLLLELQAGEDLALVIATHNQKLAARMSRQMELVGGRLHG